MITADSNMSAAQKSIFVGQFRVANQRFGQSAQLLLVTLTQLAIKPNQATFNMRKLIPPRYRHFNVTDIGVCAIQHAYHSIKSIADALIWGRAGVMAETLCSGRSFESVVGHGLNKTPDGPLILRRDAAVLLDDAVLSLGQRIGLQSGAYPTHDVEHIKSQGTCSDAQIGSRGIASTGFVIPLSSFRDTKMFRKLILRQPSLGALLAQPCANLFRECQYFSIRIFTLAGFCHILRSSSHENARNCTMPNSAITEQARQQARASLEKRGQTAKNFASLHNLNPSTVYAVLNGQSQCRRGEAHRAAVLLGIKDGVIAQ
jgi:gp16 family phage-associated protein